MCSWLFAEAHIFLCVLLNHQKWLKSRCTYTGHPKWQCMHRDAKHPLKTIFLWSLSAIFGYRSLARSFHVVDWLTGFPLHFPNKSEKCRHISGWCLPLVFSGYSGTSIWRTGYTVLIIIIFYCYQEEECRSLYRELRCYRNSLYGGPIMQATATNMQTVLFQWDLVLSIFWK